MLKVMVIDDDVILSHAIARALRGYDLTIEHDPTDAIAHARHADHEAPFELVICDARMPGLAGPQVFAAMRELCTPPQFIMMSGSSEVYSSPADANMLKPFSAGELRATVDEVMTARTRTSTRKIRRMA
jgi:DNA-binding response OmpR family regulator